MNSSAVGQRRRRRTLPTAASSTRFPRENERAGAGRDAAGKNCFSARFASGSLNPDHVAVTDKKFNPLPGFGLTMGYTLLYLSVLVLLPLAGLFLRAFEISPAQFWNLITNERALAAFRLTFGASLIAASLNAFFGALLAWVLVRYDFYGRRFIDAMVDFPFALPTAVAGLTLCSLF